METTETVAANTQTTTTAVEAPATTTATAATETGKQTTPRETQTTQSTEKPATETTTTTEAAKAATTPVVPEKYEFKAPEGAAFDPAVIEDFSGAAKAAGLSQDAAQKLIETMAPALAKRQAAQVEAIHEEWRTASAADKEIGGEKFQENLGVAKKAYDNFATPELRKLLDDTGMGNHPEVIRLMLRIGKAISEDKVIVGNTGSSKAVDPTTVLYPTMKKE